MPPPHPMAPPDGPPHPPHRGKLDISSVRLLVSAVNRHLRRLLADPSSRLALQRRCASRLAKPRAPADFSDHSVLSNLYWGLQNLHAAASSSSDPPAARLAAAERMLQVPALLDEHGSTAGVDNRFLVCCAYFCLALLRRLQGDDEWQVAAHFLHALLVSPRHVRAEFAAGLCADLWPPSRLAGGRGRGEDREGREEELDEFVRREARRYKDWIMYYQVVSCGETPRWIKGCPCPAPQAGAAAVDASRQLLKCDATGEDLSVRKEVVLNNSFQQDMLFYQQHIFEDDGGNDGAIFVDKAPIGGGVSGAEHCVDGQEDGLLPRNLEEGFYDEDVGGFDIKQLQEMLEESQSESSDSFYSQVDSSDGSDIEVKMPIKDSSVKAVSVHQHLSASNAHDRNAGDQSPCSSHHCTEISTAERRRYSMHIEACSFRAGYLLPDQQNNGPANDLTLSVLDVRDVHPYPSYKCYMGYGTPPERSPTHEIRCFGHFPSKLLRRYGFTELPRGGVARRKLNFSNIDKDWSEATSTYENDTQIEFMGRFEKAVSTLCFSEGSIGKSKDTGLEVMNVWKMLNHRSETKFSTLKQQILNQLLDVVSTSREEKFVRTSISILLLMVSEDKSVLEDIKKKNSHLFDLARSLKANVHEACVLIHMLKPSPNEIKALEILPALVEVVCSTSSNKWGSVTLPLSPKAASVGMLETLVTAFDPMTNCAHLAAISSPEILSKLVNVARNKNVEEGIQVASILVRCMRHNGSNRKFLSQVTPKDPFLHFIRSSDKRTRCAALEYFHEIFRMPRSSATALLYQIRKQGGISILHTLMACIQQTQREYRLLAANILLQLDMLEDSCGKSVFKEEALDILIDSLESEDNANTQILSAFILSNLGGTYAWNGEPYTAAWLLKKAGLSSLNDRNMIRNIDWHDACLQDSDLDAWSSKIAKGVLRFGSSIFGALAKGLESKIKSVSRDSLIAIAWLGCEMANMGSSSLRCSACETLLGGIVRFLYPGSDLDERVLACLCIYNFASGKGMQKLKNFSEGVRESLRRLSGTTWMAEELLKATDYFIPTKPRVSCVHTQILEAGKVGNAAVSSLIFYKGQLYSGYVDGSIKVWDVKGQVSKLIWDVKAHRKSVTCFALFEPEETLLSGSLDKTIRVWKMSQKKLECTETIEIKEPVHSISSFGDRILIISRSKGLKVYRSSKLHKILCQSKHIKSLAVSQSKLYVGCTDSSIQEVDIIDNQEQEIRAPSKVWQIQNKPISSIHVHKSCMYCAGSNVEEANVKDWKRRNKPKVSITLSRGSSVQEMSVVEDFIYFSSSSSPSILQIWLRGQHQKVGRLSAGSKITSLITANDMVLCGTEAGLIKGWIPL